jgi:hypothetical protein
VRTGLALPGHAPTKLPTCHMPGGGVSRHAYPACACVEATHLTYPAYPAMGLPGIYPMACVCYPALAICLKQHTQDAPTRQHTA